MNTLNREKLLEIVHEEAGRTLSRDDFDLCVRIAERASVLSAAQEEREPQPVAWVRRHPDGALTAEFLEDAAIEPVRKKSGAWVPLYLAPPSSNQVWNEAVEAAANTAKQWNNSRIVEAVQALKRPLQTQEPTAGALVTSDHDGSPCGQCGVDGVHVCAASASGAADSQTLIKALQFYADGLTDDGSVARVALWATKGGAVDSQPSSVTNELPPLPEPKVHSDDVWELRYFTASQMREYALLSCAQAAQQTQPVSSMREFAEWFAERNVEATGDWRAAAEDAQQRIDALLSQSAAQPVSDEHILNEIDYYTGRRPDGRMADSLCKDLRALFSQSAAPAPSDGATDCIFDDWPEYHPEAMGCGLEDHGITDRYDAMRYGWDQCTEQIGERIEQFCANLPRFEFEAAAPVSEQPAANEQKPCRACDDSVGYVCEEHGEQPAAQTAGVSKGWIRQKPSAPGWYETKRGYNGVKITLWWDGHAWKASPNSPRHSHIYQNRRYRPIAAGGDK